MKKIELSPRRILAGTVLAAGALALATGCGLNRQPAIAADEPATLVDKDEDTYWVAGTGFDHWQTDFHFILRQCGRADEEIADDEGCVTLDVLVSAPTYAKYEPDDSIVFDDDVHGALVEG